MVASLSAILRSSQAIDVAEIIHFSHAVNVFESEWEHYQGIADFLELIGSPLNII